MNKVHFIAIGGAVMHNLALALHHKGFIVTGSDDEFFEPSKSRLANAGLLPQTTGWHAERITPDLDAVILGMHAREDNPELIEARRLGIKVYSFPEYLYQQTRNKIRVVVGGSHGKTTTTSMIMHVLRTLGKDFDYMVGAQIEGFDTMVRLTEEAPVAIFEGDEYLSSPLDLTPKFHRYKPHVALLTGIAWDHINVFPTWDNYVSQFATFAQTIEQDGSLVYFNGDEQLCKIAQQLRSDIKVLPYTGLDYCLNGDTTVVTYEGQQYNINVFGKHNMQNMHGAMLACMQIGVAPHDFLRAIESFSGAAKRLQKLKETTSSVAYLDFAHSPSKLKATTEAVRERYPKRKLVAVMELHTFSSLTKAFLPQYAHTMDAADMAYVYFNPEVVAHKRLEEFDIEAVEKAFENKSLKVYTDSAALKNEIQSIDYTDSVLLIMTSGNFSGIDIKSLAEETIK